ncbi:MATE family efflux transporter [Rhizobium sp.]|jgi:putative MATE family efflux protein|uniref:MATE family efflux transporter n=1 Tax=Rhizobium sp. TaxID=391 RepID=UPI000E8257AB|nr:MATE family efflux transporter [Rhizobium sp.]
MNDLSSTPTKRRNRAAPENLASANIWRLMLRLGLPATAGLSINAAHHTINMVFVGMIGSHEIAAVLIVLPILMMFAALGEGLGVGVATEAGRALGCDDFDRANGIGTMTLWAGLGLGALASLITLAFASPLLRVFGATDAILPEAERYLWIAAFSLPLTMAQIILDFLAIAEGNARFSMWTLIACFTLNIVLDPLMIFGFGLGLQGVAIATILSQFVALGAYGYYHRKHLGIIRLTLWPNLRKIRSVIPVLTIGAPTTAASLVTAAAVAMILAIAGHYRGEDGIAGVGIALRLLAAGTLPIIGISLGAQAILSFAWGAKDTERVLAASKILLTMTSGMAVVYALCVMIWHEQAAMLFTTDPNVILIASPAILVNHAPLLLFGLRQTTLVLIQAQGRARLSMLLGLAPNGYLLFPLLVVFVPAYAFNGLLAAILLSSLLAGLIALVALRRTLHALKHPASALHPSMRPAPRFCP